MRRTASGNTGGAIARRNGHPNSSANGICVGVSSFHAIMITWLLALSLSVAPLLGWSYYAPELCGMRYRF